MYGPARPAPSGPPTAGPSASASCFTSAKAELYCPTIPSGARSATSGATVGDSIASPSPNSAYVEMNAAAAIVWLPCPRPGTPATSQATVQIRPTSAITRLRRRCSTSLSTTNCATTITAVLAASAIPSVDGEIPAASIAERRQTRLELPVAGEEHHEAQHAQLHHGPVPSSRLHALPGLATRPAARRP